MNLIIYLIFGALVGYVASRIMHTNSQQGLLLDIVVGVVGAFLAGYFLSPLFGVGNPSGLRGPSLDRKGSPPLVHFNAI